MGYHAESWKKNDGEQRNKRYGILLAFVEVIQDFGTLEKAQSGAGVF